jgi:tRNA nucleotidyltransferase/poly(A) polymerase
MPGTPTTEGQEMLRTVASVLDEHGAEGWLVGGTVRDRELGRYSPDIDLAVAGDTLSIAKAVARALGAPWFTLSEPHQAYRVVGKSGHVDLATVRGRGIVDDLAERDFTVNAIAVPAGGGEVIDPLGGLADLKARRLVAVSARIFRDDPLRLMRAARFGHVLGLALDPGLERAVQAQAAEVKRAAPERVAAEMVLTLAAGRAGAAARLWRHLGLLEMVLPELAPPGSVFERLDRLEEILADIDGWFPEVTPMLEQRLRRPVDGAVERSVALRLACLLDELSPAEALEAGRRLRLSSALVSLLETAARLAAVPGSRRLPALRAVGSTGAPGRAAVLFLWAAAPWEPETILLAAAAAPEGSDQLRVAGDLLTIWGARVSRGAPPLPFDGVALMVELDLAPGPQLGEALRAARLAWEAGEATTSEEALAAARKALAEA